MNLKSKKVSIVICTFNGASFIKEQLDSIINQTYPIFEIIIQDDISTDQTYPILQQYEKTNPIVHVFKNEIRKGINRNFFSAIERTTGEYIAISDQDDIWELNKIELQMETIGDNWLSSGFSKPFSSNEDLVSFDQRIPNLSTERLIHMGCLPGHTLLFKREFYSMIPQKQFCENFVYDHLFQIVGALYGRISFCPSILVNYRVHVSSATYTPIICDYKKNLKNTICTVFRTFFCYIEIRQKMQAHFEKVYELLGLFPDTNSEKISAQKLALYQSQQGFLPYIKLTLACIASRRKLFHTIEPNSLLTFLRAVYFPISCSDYFRYWSKSYSK